jgi:hypothetical protein
MRCELTVSGIALGFRGQCPAFFAKNSYERHSARRYTMTIRNGRRAATATLLRPFAVTERPANTTTAFQLLPPCVRVCSASLTACSEVLAQN